MKKLVRYIAIGVVAGIAVWFGGQYGWRWWTEGRFLETTDNAYVRADVTPVAPKVGGYIVSVDVEDNQRLEPGQVLFRIENSDYRARVEQARAEVEGRRAAFEGAKSQLQLQRSLIAQAEADARSTAAEDERARADFDRYTQLAAKDVTSTQRVDIARADARKAAAAVAVSQAKVVAERDRVAVLKAQQAGALAALEQAQATLKLAEIDLANTVVRAAVSGVAGNRQVRVGRYVQPGVQLLAIVPLADAYVVANFKETQLDRMRVGQRVKMEVDSYPGRVISGRVDSLSPASGAQFALLPPDNATGNFTKVVQRIPVKIVIDPDGPLAGELRPGMSVIAKVDTRTAAFPAVTPIQKIKTPNGHRAPEALAR
ncbi:MAG: rane fusion protein multidrug efflux system [Alphaproteobacteria bacterium]|nr:rane fusion protein multidrug efflux system [Alphaproteobacteria bacterium]